MHKAVKDDNISNVWVYLHRGCDINKQDVYGKTPLHYAYETGNKEIIQILLKCPEIKVNIKDNTDCIPVDLFLSINLEDNIDKLGETF